MEDLYLYLVEDENYRMVVRANDWIEAKEKACDWFKGKYDINYLDIAKLQVSICDNSEVIE